MEIVFSKSSSSFCIFYPLLFAGLDSSYDFDIVEEETNDGSLKDITLLASKLCRRTEEGIKTFFRFDIESKSAFPTLCCVLRRLKPEFDTKTAVRFVKTSALSIKIKWVPTKEQLWMVDKYRTPINVIFCGDRNNAICFEETITFELKSLPEDSIVFHGGCKGVDLFVEDIAKNLGISTRSFPVSNEEWISNGLSAGPKRNEEMLNFSNISYVVAFHPDILMSKGTKDMMFRAWKKGIPVYIHDLKRKSKFEGDFTVL